jgi:hypothetical protein
MIDVNGRATIFASQCGRCARPKATAADGLFACEIGPLNSLFSLIFPLGLVTLGSHHLGSLPASFLADCPPLNLGESKLVNTINNSFFRKRLQSFLRSGNPQATPLSPPQGQLTDNRLQRTAGMSSTLAFAVLAASFVSQAAAHGFVQSCQVGNTVYHGFDEPRWVNNKYQDSAVLITDYLSPLYDVNSPYVPLATLLTGYAY